MPYLDTTRTSTLYSEFSTNYQYRSYNPTALVPVDQTWNSYRTNWQFSGHLGFSANCSWVEVKTQPGGPGTAWNVWLYLRVVSNNGAGVTTTQDILIYSNLGISGATTFIDFGGSISGNHSASVGTDVLWDITENADPTVYEYAINPRYTTYNWYEKATVGSTAVITTTVTGKGSATATGTVSTTRAQATYEATLGASGFCLGNVSHNFALSNIKVNNVFVVDVVHSHTWYAQTATEWSYTLIGGYDAFGVATGANGTISTTSALLRKVNVAGKFFSWKSFYDNAQSVSFSLPPRLFWAKATVSMAFCSPKLFNGQQFNLRAIVSFKNVNGSLLLNSLSPKFAVYSSGVPAINIINIISHNVI